MIYEADTSRPNKRRLIPVVSSPDSIPASISVRVRPTSGYFLTIGSIKAGIYLLVKQGDVILSSLNILGKVEGRREKSNECRFLET